ncbi:MAG: MFS transporter [Eubacteriales bacterium]
MNNNKKIYIFLAIVAYQCIGANIAHPVTPTLITDLGLPDYSFGLFFAGMAFTNFLFSPMWARLVDKFGSKIILGVCCTGYSLSQVMFACFTTVQTIMFARLSAGFFVGGIMVSYLTHTVYLSEMLTRGRNLAYLATTSTVFSTFGYFVGGMLGEISISAAFIGQVFVLFTSGILFYIFVEPDGDLEMTFDWKRDANPFLAFYLPKQFRTKAFIMIFICVFLSSMGTTGYDQTFNYYIKDVYDFSTAYNGIIKAVIGIISFIFNMTICLWLFRKTDIKKSVIWVLLGCGLSIMMSVFVSSVPLFIICILIFFGFNALYIPLLQDLSVKEDNGTTLAGMYNAMKSLGMITGALYAGFVYEVNEKLPFIIAGVLFFISVGVMMQYVREKRS